MYGFVLGYYYSLRDQGNDVSMYNFFIQTLHTDDFGNTSKKELNNYQFKT